MGSTTAVARRTRRNTVSGDSTGPCLEAPEPELAALLERETIEGSEIEDLVLLLAAYVARGRPPH